jgi:hypothetical protein
MHWSNCLSGTGIVRSSAKGGSKGMRVGQWGLVHLLNLVVFEVCPKRARKAILGG